MKTLILDDKRGYPGDKKVSRRILQTQETKQFRDAYFRNVFNFR